MAKIVVAVIVLLQIGFALVVARRVAASHRKKALQAAHPSEPWMWRREWAKNLIPDSNRQAAFGIWIFPIIWCAITFTIAWTMHPPVSRANRGAVFFYLLPLIGVVLIIAALYQTLRGTKFGTSICHLERVPVVPGRLFRGDVRIRRQLAPAEGYRLRLTNINAVTTGAGEDSSTTEHVAWDAEIVVETGRCHAPPAGVAHTLPVRHAA